jgi:hypothetical protein
MSRRSMAFVTLKPSGHEEATQSLTLREVQCGRHNARCHCGEVVAKKDLKAHEQEVLRSSVHIAASSSSMLL